VARKASSAKTTPKRDAATPDASDSANEPQGSPDTAGAGTDPQSDPGASGQPDTESTSAPPEESGKAAETESDPESSSAPESARAEGAEGPAPSDEATPGAAGPESATAAQEAAEGDADDQSKGRDAGAVNDTDGEDHPKEEETSAATSGKGDGAKGETPASAPPPVSPAVEQASPRKGGALALVLGGIIAGAIGLGAGYYLKSQLQAEDAAAIGALRAELEQKQKQQADRLSTLAERVDAIEPVDISGLRQAVAGLKKTDTALTARVTGNEKTLSALRDRLAALEKRPLNENASKEAVAAFDAKLAAVQKAIEAQRAEIEQMVARARKMQEEAKAAERRTKDRAALARILNALDTGAGYADAVAQLKEMGVEIPTSLAAAAEDGVATLAALQDSFPDAARAALAAARDAEAKTDTAGDVAAFLRRQLGMRSLEPRQGNDADAILSRAEAATREGRLADALAEIETLPEIARAEMSGWVARARQRLDALAAARSLSEELH